MSPYLIVYAFLLILATVSFFKKKDYNVLFIVSAVVLTLFLVLRYGQGSDYFSYMRLYEDAPGGMVALKGFWAKNQNIEIGWKLIEFLFQAINTPFLVFMGVVGAISVLLLCRFAVKCCPGARTFALLLAYPTLYLTYLFSGVRQGLVICVFLGLMLPFLLEKKYWQYFAVGVACIFIHNTSIVVLCAPIVILFSRKVIFLLLAGCSVLGVLISAPFAIALMNKVSDMLGKGNYFDGFSGVSWIALAERLVTFTLIAFVFFKYQKQNDDKEMELVFKIYCYGLGIYMLLCSAPMVASRMMIQIKMVEIMLAGAIIVKMPKWRLPVFVFFVALTAVMTWKNLGSYIEQGFYTCKVQNYPYVSVLHEKETIFNWRDPQTIMKTIGKRKLAETAGVPQAYLVQEKPETQSTKDRSDEYANSNPSYRGQVR